MKNLEIIKNAFKTSKKGQGMVEYGLIISLIAIAVIAALIALAPKITALFTEIGNSL